MDKTVTGKFYGLTVYYTRYIPDYTHFLHFFVNTLSNTREKSRRLRRYTALLMYSSI